MTNNIESEGLETYLSDLMTATKAGKVNWKAVNPTTYVWETGAPRNARLNLQRIDRMVPVSVVGGQVIVGGRPQPQQRIVQQPQTSYVFQAFDMATPNLPILNLESSSDPELNKRLTELFELVKSGVSQKTLDFLKSLLPG
jgi:hypothetical protein